MGAFSLCSNTAVANKQNFGHSNLPIYSVIALIIPRNAYNCNKGFPWGKLSPQVTDEVVVNFDNTSSTADAVPLPLKGKAFPWARVMPLT